MHKNQPGEVYREVPKVPTNTAAIDSKKGKEATETDVKIQPPVDVLKEENSPKEEGASEIKKEDQSDETEEGDDDDEEAEDEDEDEEDVDTASKSRRPVLSPVIPGDRKLTREEFLEQTARLLEEFVDTEDTDETISYFRDLHSPEFHSIVVEQTLIMVMEKDDRTRQLMPKFLEAIRKEADFSALDYKAIFENLVEIIPDIVLDSPKACTHLGVCIGQGLAHHFIPNDLFTKPELLGPLVKSGQAEKILAAVFETIIKEKVRYSIRGCISLNLPRCFRTLRPHVTFTPVLL